MADIFISYAREDRSRAELLAKSLKNQGWSVWWDRKIPAGKRFSEVIEEELNTARCVIVLWSIASIKSDFVQTEAAEGAERNILVPAIIDEVKIPFEFKRINAADLTGWNGESNHEGLQELLWSLTRSLGPPKGQVAVPESTKEVPPQLKETEPAKPTSPETETV